LYADTGIDLVLAGALVEYIDEAGDCGISGIGGTWWGGGMAIAGRVLEALVLDSFFSVVFRAAERRPAGSDDTGLATSNGALPEVDGLLPSSDGRGRGPSLTFGLVYCA
jgi:hypothetical protein